MPVMIPSVLDPTAPASERRVFDLLEAIPNAENWTVLHSLGLSNSYSGEYGEIDFLVIAPGNGIVCIEVKGGGASCRDGVWSTVDHRGARHELKRSPFVQVQEGMRKLINALNADEADNLPYVGMSRARFFLLGNKATHELTNARPSPICNCQWHEFKARNEHAHRV
jgi:hypothetical protein